MEDAKRYGVIETLLERKMTNNEAALALNLSKRQIQRIKKKVRQKGPEGVIHGNRGRPSYRAFDCKDRVIELVRETYFDFNFTHLFRDTRRKRRHQNKPGNPTALAPSSGVWRKDKKPAPTPKKEKEIRKRRANAFPEWVSSQMVWG